MNRLFAAVIACLIGTTIAEAAECAIGPDAVVVAQGIRQASGCRQASQMAQDCAMGAGGDVSLTAAVTEVCEKDFLAGLDQRERAAYARQRAACRHKYRHEAGTMYRSFEAFCEVRVSERYAQAARERRSR